MKACLCSLFNNLPLKFRQGAKDMKDQFATRGCSIDVLREGLKAHSPFLKLRYGVNEVSEGASQSVKPPDNKCVARS